MNKLEGLNQIGYVGKVTIKTQCIKSKKIIRTQVIKNNGSVELFRFLCGCLIQQYDSTSTPRYLDASGSRIEFAYDSISGTQNISQFESFNSVLTYKSKLSNSALKSEQVSGSYDGVAIAGNNWHAIFNGNIIYGQLKSSGAEISSLQLYASQNSLDKLIPLAYINLDEPIFLKVGEALLIEWDMSFNNWKLSN